MVEIAAGLWTGREQHLSGMTCVFFPLHLLAPQWTLLCLFALPPAFPWKSLLVSLEVPFLLGSQGFCSQSAPSCFFCCPKAQIPSSTPGMIWGKECVVSGEVWAEEQSLLVERILLSPGTWSPELLEQRACSEWHWVQQLCDSVSRTHQLSSSVVFVL